MHTRPRHSVIPQYSDMYSFRSWAAIKARITTPLETHTASRHSHVRFVNFPCCRESGCLALGLILQWQQLPAGRSTGLLSHRCRVSAQALLLAHEPGSRLSRETLLPNASCSMDPSFEQCSAECQTCVISAPSSSLRSMRARLALCLLANLVRRSAGAPLLTALAKLAS